MTLMANTISQEKLDFFMNEESPTPVKYFNQFNCSSKQSIETYRLMSNKYFTHASPTLFNAGTPIPQLSSCFLLTMDNTKTEDIFDKLKQCAIISKTSGGIGLSITNVHASSDDEFSNSFVGMLRIFNETARYSDQNNKRPGAFAIFLEPWHANIGLSDWLATLDTILKSSENLSKFI